MKFEEHKFKIQKLQQLFAITDEEAARGMRMEAYYEQARFRQVLRFWKQYAQGSQARVEHNIETVETFVAKIPSTPADWVKSLIVKWQPTLDFGWLSPKFKSYSVPTEQHITETYWNVYLLEEEMPRGMDSITMRKPSPVDWLTAMPEGKKKNT